MREIAKVLGAGSESGLAGEPFGFRVMINFNPVPICRLNAGLSTSKLPADGWPILSRTD